MLFTIDLRWYIARSINTAAPINPESAMANSILADMAFIRVSSGSETDISQIDGPSADDQGQNIGVPGLQKGK
jgi:hypothetical protein